MTSIKPLQLVLALVIVLIVGFAGYRYYQHTVSYPSTDDAYLKANVIQISPLVSGRVAKVSVKSHQSVKRNQVLLALDPLPFRYELARAKAAFDLASKNVGVQATAVTSAQSNLIRVKAARDDAKSHSNRIQQLFEQKVVTEEQAQHAKAQFEQAQAGVNQAEAELDKAVKALGKDNEENADIRQAAAVLEQAKYNLANTVIKAPYEGFLGDVNVRVGNVIHTNQMLFPLVEAHEYWVDANFKETDLTRIKVGQPAVIELDMYPDVSLKGHVASLSPASGASFSLLPPENATGNWVKVTQRFQVRIAIEKTDDLPELRIGASANVVVDSTDSH
ncbi:HlyD family secretion protein [Thalassotalea litorea]|uniref:HlyD family secretion protein n=1 Tax=Thalassotalea litorea TaxID=2020715 RepID=UPI003736E582